MTENELIEKIQKGENSLLDYVMLTPDYNTGFETFCREFGLEKTEQAAEEYLASRERDMSECVTIG